MMAAKYGMSPAELIQKSIDTLDQEEKKNLKIKE